METRNIKELLGKTVTRITQIEERFLLFYLEDSTVVVFNHAQDCCEEVYIEDICGDLQDLIGSPILLAKEIVDGSQEKEPTTKYPDRVDGSYTWTFYKFATRKGHVDVRWFGTSNGYYSERVDILLLEADDEWLLEQINEEG